MSKYTENAEKWLQLSEIDFFTHFVKSWIPFNAWYRTNYPDAGNDRTAINQIKVGSNRFKDGFRRLIQNSNLESKDFNNNLAQLHYYLENALLSSGDSQISFTKILEIDKSNLLRTETYRKYQYYINIELEDRSAKVKCVQVTVKNATSTSLNYRHNSFDAEHLNIQANTKLTVAQKEYLIPLFNQCNPRKINSLIVGEHEEYMKIGEYCFKKDEGRLFSALVEILYSLRNGLFHGEIVPDKHSSKVYKYAYEVLKNLLDQIH